MDYVNDMPHVFQLTRRAFDMLAPDNPQSLMISGESGSGKTEATKLSLQFLVNIHRARTDSRKVHVNKPWEGANHMKDKRHRRRSLGTPDNPIAKSGVSGIAARLLDINPILEAFGNAQTVKNDNSSRFGKWMQVKMRPDGSVGGGSVNRYLLEKSRVVYQSENERNYHVFYYMIQGLEGAERQQLQILEEHQYRYIRPTVREMLRDGASWTLLIQCMKAIGMTDARIHRVFELTSAILRLGNVKFSGSDAATVIEPETDMLVTSSLLKVEQERLELALTTRELTIAGEVQVLPLRSTEAEVNRDSFAKELYARLFDYVVGEVNNALRHTAQPTDTAVPDIQCSFIGFLDIFGFEDLAENSFEQLCINYANERCHQLFLHYLFEYEKRICEEEGVRADTVEFHDNLPILQLIAANVSGVFAVVNDVCQVPRTSDETIIAKLNAIHSNKHPAYGKPHGRNLRDCFVIKHSPANVRYKVNNFLSKNRDKLTTTTVNCLRASSDPMLRQLFAAEDVKEKRHTTFLSQKFLADMDGLMDLLRRTHIHFVRCIKSNNRQAPMTIDLPLVQNQFRYLGISDVCRLRQSGYYFRDLFQTCYCKYTLPQLREAGDLSVDSIKRLLKVELSKLLDFLKKRDSNQNISSLDTWESQGQIQFGHTRCFIRLHLYELLEMALGHLVSYVYDCTSKLQARIRGMQARRLADIRRNAYGNVQRFLSAKMQYLRFKIKRHRAVIVQSLWRTRTQKNMYRQLLLASARVQLWWRAHLRDSHVSLFNGALACFQKRAKAYVLRLELFHRHKALSVVRRLLRRKIRNRKLMKARNIVARGVRRLSTYSKWRGEYVEEALYLERLRYRNFVEKIRLVLGPWFRVMLARRAFRKARLNAIRIQAAVRAWLCQLRYTMIQLATILTQANARRAIACRRLMKSKTLARGLTTCWVAHLHRRRYKQLRTASSKVQTWIRHYQGRSNMCNILTAIVAVRNFMRRTLRRTKLRKLLPRLIAEGRTKNALEAEIIALKQVLRSQDPQIGIFDLDVLVGRQAYTCTITQTLMSMLGQLDRNELLVDVKITNDNLVILTSEGDLCHAIWPRDTATQKQVVWRRLQFPDLSSLSHSIGIAKLVCGENHTIVVTEDANVYTWGQGDCGQLGHGDIESIETPKLVRWLAMNKLSIVSIAAGCRHSIALTSTGLVYSWGASPAIGLGIGIEVQTLPQLVSTLEPVRVRAISSGMDFCLALTRGGEVYGWGNNQHGQITPSTKMLVTRLLLPSLLQGIAKAVSSETSMIVNICCGMDHAIALTDLGKFLSWGDNRYGQLGAAKYRKFSAVNPARPLNKKVLQAVCGARQTFALSEDGHIHAFGRLCCAFDTKGHIRDVDFPYTLSPGDLPPQPQPQARVAEQNGEKLLPTIYSAWSSAISLSFCSTVRQNHRSIRVPIHTTTPTIASSLQLLEQLGVSDTDMEVMLRVPAPRSTMGDQPSPAAQKKSARKLTSPSAKDTVALPYRRAARICARQREGLMSMDGISAHFSMPVMRFQLFNIPIPEGRPSELELVHVQLSTGKNPQRSLSLVQQQDNVHAHADLHLLPVLPGALERKLFALFGSVRSIPFASADLAELKDGQRVRRELAQSRFDRVSDRIDHHQKLLSKQIRDVNMDSLRAWMSTAAVRWHSALVTAPTPTQATPNRKQFQNGTNKRK